MTRPELLAPAGDLEKLVVALDYGADAVYAGGDRFGLRAMAGNLSLPELARARELTRERGKRLYLTLNAYLRPGEFPALADYLQELRPLDLDAYIVSDPGVLAMVRRLDPQREIHLSTQANTTNAEAARFWGAAGISRLVLARELALDEIAEIGAQTDLELEVFVHGALCVAYSGRCLLSTTLTGRSANSGTCAQPCRWEYAVVEATRPGAYFPIEEDERGSYIFNSRDLCLLEDLPNLLRAGIHSLKIEGRMKSLYYVAAVTRVYRAALDAYLADPEGYRCAPAWLGELDKVSHRPYGRGFFHGADPQLHRQDSSYRQSHDFVGVVRRVGDDGRGVVEGRNRFFSGDPLELIGPAMRQISFVAGDLAALSGAALAAGQPNQEVSMELPTGARPGDLLRRPKAGKA